MINFEFTFFNKLIIKQKQDIKKSDKEEKIDL